MKNKIGLSIATILLAGGVYLFANSGTTKSAGTTCPDRPGCICSKQTTEQVTKPATPAAKKENCPNTPGCVCK